MAADTWLEIRHRTLVVRKSFNLDNSPAGPTTGPGRGPVELLKTQQRWLTLAEGHPVTGLLDVDLDRLILTTRFAGAETALSRLRPPRETARLLAAVAAALGALHRRGLVHGKIGGDHILIDGPRFTLCSPSGLVEDPARDVAAFDPLIDVLCDRWAAADRAGSEVLNAWREVAWSAREQSISADRLSARLAALADRTEPGRLRRRPPTPSPRRPIRRSWRVQLLGPGIDRATAEPANGSGPAERR